MTEPQNRAIIAATRLQESVVGLKDEISGLRAYGRRNRHLILGLGISLALDILLTIAVIISAVLANNANDAATANRQSQIDTCNSNNQVRQVSQNLWNYILDTAAKNPENATPQRKQQITDFRAYMENAYAPRDCSKIGE